MQVYFWVEGSAGAVVEIVHRVKLLPRVVVLAEILHSLGACDGFILSRHVVRHEIDDYLQPRVVRALH